MNLQLKIKQKNKIEQLSPKYEHENDINQHSKMNELHKFVLNLSHKLDLGSSNEHVAPQNLSIYYTWKNIRQTHKNNKLEIIAPK